MKKASRDYESCISTMIPIPMDKHLALKLYCTKHGITMKEVLYDIAIAGIKDRCDE